MFELKNQILVQIHPGNAPAGECQQFVCDGHDVLTVLSIAITAELSADPAGCFGRHNSCPFYGLV